VSGSSTVSGPPARAKFLPELFPCGHHRKVKPAPDGNELTGCPVCAVDCPNEPCGARRGDVCRTSAGGPTGAHSPRIAAAGVTRRLATDRARQISPQLARAVRLFHEAMHTWRGVAADGSRTRRISHGSGWVDERDRAVVEALLQAGWTPPDQPRRVS
jgi:hypothetical protein